MNVYQLGKISGHTTSSLLGEYLPICICIGVRKHHFKHFTETFKVFIVLNLPLFNNHVIPKKIILKSLAYCVFFLLYAT